MVGMAIGNPMNIATLIAVYATLCKELNVPMRFPSSEKAYEVLVNITDTDLLAKGMEYVSLHENCKGEIFNITNGEIFRWKELWPKIGEYFGVSVAEPQTFSLAEYMDDKEQLWKTISTKFNLANSDFNRLVQWPFGDFTFSMVHDAFVDVNKFRRFGFHEMQLDSFGSYKRVFDQLKEHNIIPA